MPELLVLCATHTRNAEASPFGTAQKAHADLKILDTSIFGAVLMLAYVSIKTLQMNLAYILLPTARSRRERIEKHSF